MCRFGAPVESFLEFALLGFSRRSMVAGLIDVALGLGRQAKRLTVHASQRGKRALRRPSKDRQPPPRWPPEAEIISRVSWATSFGVGLGFVGLDRLTIGCVFAVVATDLAGLVEVRDRVHWKLFGR